MFHSDKPIDKKEYDCLNRTEFSKQLAKAILEYTRTDNFTISLCGKWGFGKTSILNMVIEEIAAISKNNMEDEKPIIIRFDPWNYSDYSKLLDYVAQFLSEIEPYLGLGKILAKLFGKHMEERAKRNRDIQAIKQKIISKLKKQKQKIIVVIDDIDRLNNSQIRAIFQLVNSLAGFPNMIYLLAFDREIVVRALQEEQKCDGEEYLEKIIQVPFDIPEADKTLVNAVFFERLTNIIFAEQYNLDHEYWGMVFQTCISPYIVNIRDVNRVLNAFEFKYNLTILKPLVEC